MIACGELEAKLDEAWRTFSEASNAYEFVKMTMGQIAEEVVAAYPLTKMPLHLHYVQLECLYCFSLIQSNDEPWYFYLSDDYLPLRSDKDSYYSKRTIVDDVLGAKVLQAWNDRAAAQNAYLRASYQYEDVWKEIVREERRVYEALMISRSPVKPIKARRSTSNER